MQFSIKYSSNKLLYKPGDLLLFFIVQRWSVQGRQLWDEASIGILAVGFGQFNCSFQFPHLQNKYSIVLLRVI